MHERKYMVIGFDGFDSFIIWPTGIERFGADVRGQLALRAGRDQKAMYLANASIIKQNAGAPHACRAKPSSPTPNAMASVLLHLGWAGTKVGVSSLTAHVKASLPPHLTAFGEFSIAKHDHVR